MRSQTPPDIHEDKPEWPIPLEYVGIKGLVETIELEILNCHPHNYTIEAYVDLPADKKGVHLSRTLKAIKKVIKKEKCIQPHHFLDDIATELLESHDYSRKAMIKLTTTIKFKETPVKILIQHEKGRDNYIKQIVMVEITGITACPCAKEVYGFFESTDPRATPTHMQRALLRATIIGKEILKERNLLNKIIDAMLQSFSAPLRESLDRIQEYNLIKGAILNPMFAEDVVRKLYTILNQKLTRKEIMVLEIESYESIHPYNVYARLEG